MKTKLSAIPVGTRYGRLTLVAHLPPPKYGRKQAQARWRCECGTEKTIRSTYVVNGHSRSCGCVGNREVRAMNSALGNGVW